MARRLLKELLESVKAIVGEDNTSEEVLKLYEDLSDSYSVDVEGIQKKYDELEEKYANLDKEWSTRYRDRFFSSDETVEAPQGNELGGDNIERRDENEIKRAMDALGL